uniref:NPH3 domain-containing protein n=1 Tax=Oryza punctata TaxID=4537 RepID=A0A0E0MIZ1_ORYPU
MDRTSQWVSSPDIPADLLIRIADDVFPLHKAVMVPKCGYIRKAVAAARGGATATVELDLSALPGGADAFDKAARYCYGANFEISVRNAAALLCAAVFLDMHPADGGLARRVEEFLAKVGLRTLPAAVSVLRSCEGLLPVAEEIGVAQRSADAIALRICNEVLFPTRSPPDWWTAELAALSPGSFHKVITALRCRRAEPEVLVAAATAYAELLLAEVLAADGHAADHSAMHRALVESVVAVLPSTDDAPLPAAFLCRLLHVAVTIGASAKTCLDLELRIAAVLEQATAGDLLTVALDGAGERVQNVDTVRRIITAFVEREAASAGGFVGLAGAVPKEARATHDCLYRAVDIYLKAHPALEEMEREKVCSVMDPLKLSYQGRLHASQNKRLPLQAVLSALYYDQLKLRSGDANGDGGGWDAYGNGVMRSSAKEEASLARENEALRSELARMRAYVSGMQQSKGTTGKKKKAGMASLWLQTLSRLNPFKAGIWAKDTSSIVDKKMGAMHSTNKPKRRRFSIS